jgi:hypothetical protein
MSAYAERRGVAQSSLRFTLDGERINPEDTPKMVLFDFPIHPFCMLMYLFQMELEENDQIDVLLEQTGGF